MVMSGMKLAAIFKPASTRPRGKFTLTLVLPENVSVTLTRIYNPAIMTWAAIFAVVLAFIGKIGAILQTIPVPVMGGIMVLLFGAITVVGLNTLVKTGDDLTEPRNLIIVALILIFGIGGMTFSVSEFTLRGIGLAGIVGVILNLILPKSKGQ